MLVDADARCLYRNESADMAIANRRGLSLTANETIRCAEPAAQQALLDAIRLAGTAKLVAPRRVYLRSPEGRLALVMVISMLRGELASICSPAQPCAAVFVHAPSEPRIDAATILREAFRLTPAEARLAALVADGTSVFDCAERLHVSAATVRTQLRRLFEKTSTQKQSQLVAVLDAALHIS
jgi:DNA-binding CsgD family transcriptional regulator